MGFKVILSPAAIKDLELIVRYISLDNPQAAERFGNRLIDEAMSLADFPERGHFVPEFADGMTREVPRPPYRIVYRVDAVNKAVQVSRFWHSAMPLAPRSGKG